VANRTRGVRIGPGKTPVCTLRAPRETDRMRARDVERTDHPADLRDAARDRHRGEPGPCAPRLGRTGPRPLWGPIGPHWPPQGL